MWLVKLYLLGQSHHRSGAWGATERRTNGQTFRMSELTTLAHHALLIFFHVSLHIIKQYGIFCFLIDWIIDRSRKNGIISQVTIFSNFISEPDWRKNLGILNRELRHNYELCGWTINSEMSALHRVKGSNSSHFIPIIKTCKNILLWYNSVCFNSHFLVMDSEMHKYYMHIFSVTMNHVFQCGKRKALFKLILGFKFQCIAMPPFPK